MRSTLIQRFFVVVLVAVAAAPAEAQLGGLMRRAKEAAEKKAAEKDPRAPEPSASTANPFADPAIVLITQDQLARFEKALQYEIAQRNELRKALASARSPEEYQACNQRVGTSPEMMKLIQDMADSSANATPEQLMKSQQKMYADMQVMVAKSCGPDPGQSQSSRMDRLRQIEAEASDIAMPPGYTPPAGAQGRMDGRPGDVSPWWHGRTASPNVALAYRARRASIPSLEARRAQAPAARPFARQYGMLKERVPVFCAKDRKVSPPTTITIGNEKVSVVKVQGMGQEYMYRQDEVDALTKQCGSVMALMNSLFDLNVP